MERRSQDLGRPLCVLPLLCWGVFFSLLKEKIGNVNQPLYCEILKKSLKQATGKEEEEECSHLLVFLLLVLPIVPGRNMMLYPPGGEYET